MLLNCFGSAFAGAYADAIVHGEHEDFSVADLPVFSAAPSRNNCVDGGFDEVLVHGDLQLHFAEQVDCDLPTAVDLGLSLLAAEPLDVHNRQTHDLDFGKRRLHVFQFARLNNGEDEFHGEFGMRISECGINLRPASVVS